MKIQCEIQSRFLGRKVPYVALLPADYETSNLRYPVLYLLHGLFGHFENWIELTDITNQAVAHQLIVVMPDGADGWYTDSATVEAERYETFILVELLGSIGHRYRTHEEKAGRAIAGLSMGGYGAFKFALKRPDLFRVAASFSGAFEAPERTPDIPGFNSDELSPSIMKAFGPRGSRTRVENSLFRLIEGLSETDVLGLPFFYFNCGTEDRFLQTNLRLDKAMRKKGIVHEYQEIIGGHDWDYWGSQVTSLLSLVTAKLKQAESG